MRREREQFWLIAACVIALHAVALAAVTVGWACGSEASRKAEKAVEVALVDPVVKLKEVEPPEPDPDQMLGEKNAKGDSIATVDLPQTAVSDKPDDLEQAWTRRKPAPLPRPAAQAVDAKQTPQALAEEIQKASSLGPTSVTAMSPLAVQAPVAKEQPIDKPTKEQTEQQNEKEVGKTSTDQPAVEQAKQTEEAKPAEPQKPAEAVQASAEKPDPAQQGESDLDPFAQDEGVTFSPGGTTARNGREVKLVRPRIDLGFMADATRITRHDIVVRMWIETDGTGHPSRVKILESSGSEVIDDAVRLAMYDSWFGGKTPDGFRFAWILRRE